MAFDVKIVACRLTGIEAYIDASKACWQDMMRASRVKEEAGEPGMMMACGKLVELTLDCARERMSTTTADYAGAEALIQEAEEVQIVTHCT